MATPSPMMFYTYRGDKLTDPALRGMQCDPVLRDDGKCIRGSNGNMLVVDAQGTRYVVLGRQLRRNDKLQRKQAK